MFGRLTSMYKLSEASGVVKEVLLGLPLPMLPFDADAAGCARSPPHATATSTQIATAASGRAILNWSLARLRRSCVASYSIPQNSARSLNQFSAGPQLRVPSSTRVDPDALRAAVPADCYTAPG